MTAALFLILLRGCISTSVVASADNGPAVAADRDASGVQAKSESTTSALQIGTVSPSGRPASSMWQMPAALPGEALISDPATSSVSHSSGHSRLIRHEGHPLPPRHLEKKDADADAIPSSIFKRPWALVQRTQTKATSGSTVAAQTHSRARTHNTAAARAAVKTERDANRNGGAHRILEEGALFRDGQDQEEADMMQNLDRDLHEMKEKKLLLKRIRELKSKLADGRRSGEGVADDAFEGDESVADEVGRLSEEVAQISKNDQRQRSNAPAKSTNDFETDDEYASAGGDFGDALAEEETEEPAPRFTAAVRPDALATLQEEVRELKEALLKRTDTEESSSADDDRRAKGRSADSEEAEAIQELRKEFAQLREDLKASQAPRSPPLSLAGVRGTASGAGTRPADTQPLASQPAESLPQTGSSRTLSSSFIATSDQGSSAPTTPLTSSPKAADRARRDLQAAEQELDEAAKRRVADLEAKVARLRQEAAKESALSFLEVSHSQSPSATVTYSRKLGDNSMDALGECEAPVLVDNGNAEAYIECIGGTCENAAPSFIKGLLGPQARDCHNLIIVHERDCAFDLSMGYPGIKDGTPLGWLCNAMCPKNCYSLRRFSSKRDGQVILLKNSSVSGSP